MRPRNTLVALLVLAALGAYVYWVELPRQARQAEEKRLLAFDKESVTAVTLDYADRSIALDKSPEGRWRIVRPIEADADETAVKNMVNAIADAQVTRTLEDVADKLPSYGLDKPEATITLRLKDGTDLPPIKVGTTTQVGFSAYVQKGADPEVYITAAAFQSGMKKDLKDLRDKSVIAFEDKDVQQIELRRRTGGIVIERQGEGDRWEIAAPARYPADSSEVRALLASARGLRADDFVSDHASADLGTYGLTSPQLTLSVWLGKDRAQKTLLIGGVHEDPQKKTLYAKRGERPTVYTIADYSFKNLDKDLGTLRDKTVLPFEKEKTAKIAVTRKEGAGFTLAKREGTWHVEGPGEGTERAPTISRFVDDVAGLKGNEIVAEGGVDLAKYGLDDPDVSIAVSDENGAPLGTLMAARGTAGGGSDAEAQSFVAAQDRGIVYGVKPYVYDRIDKRAADLREPPATPVPSGAATASPAEQAAALPFDEENLGIDDEGLDDKEWPEED